MSYFIVTLQSRGKKVTHALHADSKAHAQQLARLKFKGTIIKIHESHLPIDEQLKNFWFTLRQNFSRRKIRPDQLIAAINQLAVMTNAGLSINDSLMDIAKATTDSSLKHILTSLSASIDAGNSLTTAVKEFRYELGNLTLAMIELGEQTGNLSDALLALSGMLEEIRENVKKFKKSMAYPRNIFLAMGFAFYLLLTQVVPKFEKMFAKMGSELPLPTQILLTLSDALVHYGLWVLGALVVLYGATTFAIRHYDTVRYMTHQLVLHIKILNGIVRYATLSRFTLVFTQLIHAGIPIAEALDTSIGMIDNMVLKRKLMTLRLDVEKGLSLHEAFANTKLFENMIVQMIGAGEAGGQLDNMMQKVSDYYKMKFDAIIDNLQSAVEPLILVVIGGFVVLIALGIFMPMWGLAEAAKH
ncbi:MAG: type II secretion system protein F [Sulfuricurvum sp. PC08-66]|nr:MAG: type II secretion system protein F [Sulfuricurvum sp. PC08-66]